MSVQTSITNYFNTKKRCADNDAINKVKKVLILDNKIVSKEQQLLKVGNDKLFRSAQKIRDETDIFLKRLTPVPPTPKKTPKFSSSAKRNKKNFSNYPKSDIKRALFKEKKGETKIPVEETGSVKTCDDNLKMVSDSGSNNEKLISAVEKIANTCSENLEKDSVNEESNLDGVTELQQESIIKSNSDNKEAVTNPKIADDLVNKSKQNLKEFNLQFLKEKLKNSSRLHSLKTSLNRINKGYAELDKITSENKRNEVIEKPKIKKFENIEFEMSLISPNKKFESLLKTPLKSPAHYQSPIKTRNVMFTPSRVLHLPSPGKLREEAFKRALSNEKSKTPISTSPNIPLPRRKLFFDDKSDTKPSTSTTNNIAAYQRYSSLTAESCNKLTLPYKYRHLAELFRDANTILSILTGRLSNVPFSKLKHSIQELNHKNFTQKHLAQVQSLYDAFIFTIEKVHIMGNAPHEDKYELMIRPKESSQKNNNTENQKVLTTEEQLKRKREFYNILMNKTKDHHQEFLMKIGLDVDRDKLTRWHPDFDLESCPDIEPIELPKPPENRAHYSASEVLNKAKELFIVNRRVGKALESLANKKSDCEQEINKDVNNSAKTAGGVAADALAKALKGIPIGLLEKVRARQSAKVSQLLTRSESETMQMIEYSRLPALARIINCLYITAKKCALTKAAVLERLQSSYTEILRKDELEHHLNLLIEKVPGWLTLHNFDKVSYLKINKDISLSKINNILNDLTK